MCTYYALLLKSWRKPLEQNIWPTLREFEELDMNLTYYYILYIQIKYDHQCLENI